MKSNTQVKHKKCFCPLQLFCEPRDSNPLSASDVNSRPDDLVASRNHYKCVLERGENFLQNGVRTIITNCVGKLEFTQTENRKTGKLFIKGLALNGLKKKSRF